MHKSLFHSPTQEGSADGLPADTPSLTSCGAFIGRSGRLYVRVHRLKPTETGDKYHPQTAVYPSVAAYNERTATPEYAQLADVLDDFLRPVTINLQTLTIVEPPSAGAEPVTMDVASEPGAADHFVEAPGP